MRRFLSRLIFPKVLLITLAVLPGRAWAQSGTVTDDGFLSSSTATQQVNLNGQGVVLIVGGSSATVGSASVGTTKTYIKSQLLSSLPQNVAATNVAKATLKLYLSPGTNPSGTIDIYPITSAWTEATLKHILAARSIFDCVCHRNCRGQSQFIPGGGCHATGAGVGEQFLGERRNRAGGAHERDVCGVRQQGRHCH